MLFAIEKLREIWQACHDLPEDATKLPHDEVNQLIIRGESLERKLHSIIGTLLGVGVVYAVVMSIGFYLNSPFATFSAMALCGSAALMAIAVHALAYTKVRSKNDSYINVMIARSREASN